MSSRAANRLVYLKVDKAASGDLVAAPSGATVGQKIRVVGYTLVAAGAVTVKFQSGGSTDLTGAMSLITGTPVEAWGSAEAPVLSCGKDEKLNIVLSGAVQVSGHITYEIVPAIP
jgi:hypothetical protein